MTGAVAAARDAAAAQGRANEMEPTKCRPQFCELGRSSGSFIFQHCIRGHSFLMHEPAVASTPNWSLEPSARRKRKLHPLPRSDVASAAAFAAAASIPSSAVSVRLTTSEMTPRNKSNLNLEWEKREHRYMHLFVIHLFTFSEMHPCTRIPADFVAIDFFFRIPSFLSLRRTYGHNPYNKFAKVGNLLPRGEL